MPDGVELPYVPFYCEENAWHICQHPTLGDGPREVVWITNARRQVAMFGQDAAPPGQPVAWDYHVVVVAHTDAGAVVFDPAARLPCPTPCGPYLDATFPVVPPAYAPLFRVIGAPSYVETFASDRRHMRDADGQWLRTPPPWPAIGRGHRLDAFLDIGSDGLGPWIDLAALRQRYP